MKDVSIGDISQDIEMTDAGDYDSERTPNKSHRSQLLDRESPNKTPRRSVVSSLLSPTRLGAELAVPDMALVLFKEQEDEANENVHKDRYQNQVPGDNHNRDSTNKVSVSSGVQTESRETLAESRPATKHMKGLSVDDTSRHSEQIDGFQQTASSLGMPSPGEPTIYYEMPMPTPSWISTHDNIPYVLSTYLQLMFNMSVFCIFLYIVSSTIVSFWRDVDKKISFYRSDLINDIGKCTREYLENDCRPGLRAPALEEMCEKLEKCMDQDPDAIRRLPVNAELFAEIINSFIEPFSFRSLFISVFTILGALFVSNFAFGFFRAKAYYVPNHNPTSVKRGGLLSHPPRSTPPPLQPVNINNEGYVYENQLQ